VPFPHSPMPSPGAGAGAGAPPIMCCSCCCTASGCPAATHITISRGRYREHHHSTKLFGNGAWTGREQRTWRPGHVEHIMPPAAGPGAGRRCANYAGAPYICTMSTAQEETGLCWVWVVACPSPVQSRTRGIGLGGVRRLAAGALRPARALTSHRTGLGTDHRAPATWAHPEPTDSHLRHSLLGT
jgi:hypothetical protein